MILSRLSKASLILVLLVFTACTQKQLDKKATLSDYLKWSKTLPELPVPDNKDFLNADYTSFYESLNPGFLARTISRIRGDVGVKNRAPWTPDTFLKLLSNLTEKRTAEGLSRRHAAVLKASSGTHLYIFGDLQGAFHSLLRDLAELRNRNVIDDNFKIKDPKAYFVFNGNQIDRSPYVLESLSIIFILMQNNENNVIYTAGRHELDNTWRDYGTEREIVSRFQTREGVAKLAKDTLSTFFETLPVSFFVQDSRGTEKTVLKIYGHEETIENDQAGIADELEEVKPGVLTNVPIHLTRLENNSLVVDAVVEAISRSTSYHQTDGLEMILQENGAVAWSSLSSPIFTYQKLFGFFNDAYVDVQINDYIRNSTISLVSQDARKQNGYQVSSRHLITGKVIDPKSRAEALLVEESPLRFASIMDLSGPSRVFGQRVLSGVDLHFRKNNGYGNFYRIFSRDDRSSSSKWIEQLLDLQNNYAVSALIAPSALATTPAMFSEIHKNSTYLFFPASGASGLRDETLKNIILLRTSTKTEVCALTRYAKDSMFSRKVGLFYQNDNFGKDSLAAAKQLLSKGYKMAAEDICEIPYEPNSLDMEKPAKDFKKCLPDALIFVATQTAAQAFIHELGTQSLAKTKLLGVSNVSDLLRPSLGSATSSEGLSIIISRVVPSPFDKSLKITEHYQEEMDKWYAGALYNSESFEGYLATSILMDAVASVEKPATPSKIMRWLEGLKSTSYKGINLNFNPKNRELMDTVWIDTGSRKWIEFQSANSLCL